MYGNFEGWLQSNGYPWETYEDSRERYERLYGEDEPEVELTDSPAYTFEPEVEEEEEGGFLSALGDAGEYVGDVWSGMTGPGLDQLQGSMGTLLADQVAGSLPESLQEYEQPLTELGNEIYYDNIKEAEAYGPPKPSRLEQNVLDDPNYQKALSKEEYIAQNPSDSWLNPEDWKTKFYKNAPDWLPSWEKFKETAPTGTELGEMIPSSIAPSIAGRVAGGVVGSVAGVGGTYAGQMAGGAGASSLMTSAEVSREIRDNPTVRKILGLDPNVTFQDDSYENKNRMNKLAKMVAKNSFANRITSSGIPEMAGYMAFGRGLGGVMSRALVDVGGGTASELLDIDMSRRSVVESVVDFAKMEGNPLSEQQVAQLNQTLYEIGPKKREIFAQAFISELALGAPGSMIEGGLEVAQDHRVDEIDTDTAEMEKMKKEFEKGDEKRLEVVGGAFTEIQALYDGDDPNGEEKAYELYKTINKENKKQNALSDLLQKRRYEDIYKSFLERDNAEALSKENESTAQEVEDGVSQAEETLTTEDKNTEKEIEDEVTTEAKDQGNAEKALNKENKDVEKEIEDAVEDQVKAGEAEEKNEAAKKVGKKKEATAKKKKKKAEMTAAATALAKKQAEEQSASAEKKAKKDTKKELKGKAKLKAAEAKRRAEKTETVETIAPKTLIDRYNNALRNPKGETRITMPETHRNKDNTIKDVLIEWEDGSDTFTRAELQELGAIQKKGDRESYVANSEVKTGITEEGKKSRKKLLQKTLKKTKSEDTAETTEDLETTLEDEGAESVADNVSKDTTVPVESIYTEDVKGRLSGLNKQHPKGMTETDVQFEEMSQAEDKKENAGKNRDLTVKESDAAEARGTRKFAKALVQSQKKKKKTPTVKATPAKKGDKKTASAKYVETKIKEWNKKNKKATPKENEAAQLEFAKEFINKEKTKKLATTIEEETKEAEAKKKEWEEGTPVEADTEGQVLSSATGRTRTKGKSIKLKRTDAPGISKEGVQSGIETFKKNSKQKIKDMNITALSKDDDADVETVREIYRAEYDSRGLDPAGKDEWVENNTQAIFEGGTEGFVDNRTGDIYMVADNIMAVNTSTSAIDRLAQVLFHETIGHVGLRAFLGAQFDTFINRFLKTNKKLLKRWATEGTGQAYLPTELQGKELKVRQRGYDKMSSDELFTIAEEYIAQHFAEHGARDPNLIDRIAVHIARALNKQGLWENMTTNEAKLTLREVQQEYIGGNRNFITGENFAKVPLFIHHDDEKLEGETGDVEGSVEGIREAGLLSDEELAEHLADNPYTETEVEVEPDGESVSKSIRVPKKTVKKVYKLMEIRDGQLFYPFVEPKGKEKLKGKPQYPVSLGEWQNASFVLPKDMPGKGRGMGLAPRGGFHLTENLTPHLMTKLKDGTTRVWVEVEIGDDTNYQDRVGESGKDTDFLLKKDKDGNVIDGKVPEGGQYRFRRPAKEGGWWRIAGEMRLLRILPESESTTLLNEYVTSKEYTDALARSEKKKATAESKMLGAVSKSKALGLYAKYNKDAGTDGTMLLHKNTIPDQGPYRITFFREDGSLDTLRTKNGHEHFPTLKKAKSRLSEVGDGIQDISGGRAIKGVSKSVRKTYRDEKSDSTMDWVQDSGMRGAEVDRENLELELRWLKMQEEKKKLKGVSKSVRKTYQDERTDSTIDWVQDRGMRGAELDRENLEMELRWLREQEEMGNRKGVSKSVRKKTTFADEMAEVEERMEIDRLKKWQKEFKEFSKRGEETGVYEKGPEMRYNDWLSAQQGVGISKPKTDQVNISKEAKRRWEKSSINFSKRLRRNEIPQGTIIRDRVLLDMSNIKGLSAADIRKISSGNGPFIFMWDRMRGDGFYKTPSGVKIALQGGMSNSYLTYNMEAGIIGSSTSGGTISDVVTARVNESNGYGIVGLMSPSGHGSNPTFFLIYTQVIRDVLGMKGARRVALENKFAELIETGSQSFKKPFEVAKTTKGTRGDQRSNVVLKKILDAETPKQKYKIFEDEGKKLTFDARKSIFTALGGEKVAKELGIPSFTKMLADTIDPEFGPKKGQTWASFETAGIYTGDLVQVMKFDKTKPLSTAQAEGLAKKHEHLSYDITFMGKVVGRFSKWIPTVDATKAFYEGDASAKIEAYRSNKGNLIPIKDRQGTTMMKMPVFLKGIPEAKRQQLFKKHAGKPKIKDTKGKALTYEQFPPDLMLEVNKKNRTKPAINASKRLVSQSVNFSNSRAENYQRTRIASKGRGPLAGLARKLTRRLISQGTLEDFELYKTLRRKTKGVIMQMEQTADRFYKIIKKSKQQKEIYDYLTTVNADKTKITDENERKLVVQVKKEIMENGRRLVEDHHLMTQKTLNRLDDQYLPRKYLKYLLRDKDYNLLNSSDGNLGNLDLSYLNKRQDIEKGVRELILGEVKDPAFLATTAFATPRKDMALLDFMESIATEGIKEGRGWVLPKTLVTFDTMGLMKQLAGESADTKKLIDELELMETKGVKVSGHWLVNESERIQNMTKHMELTPEKILLVKKLTDRMAEAGKKIVGDILPKDYMRVPKGRKYGKLQGMAIRKEIFEDLFGWSTGAGGQTFNINDDGTMDRNMAEKILGTGGTFEQYNRFWKWSKVSANPPSWVRNFVSNLIFMNMGPVPLHRMPDLFLRSLTDQISTRLKQRGGDKNNEVYDDKGNPLTDTARADSMGLTSGGFSQVELKMIKSNFEEAVRRGDPQEGIAGIMTIRNAFKGVGREETIGGKTKEVLKAGIAEPFKKYIQRPTSDLYGGIDSLGKVMMIKYLYSDKAKKPSWEGGDRNYTLEEAAAEAEKWLFDYSNPLPSVKYLRKSAFGAPFLSYPSFVAPLLIETILTKPWKFVPHLLFGEAMLMGFKSFEDISDEEYEAIVEETSSYIRNKAKGGNLDKFPGTNTPWIPRSIIPVFNPFSKEKNLDENGRAQLLQIGYLQPWGMFSDIFRQLDPTKKEGIEPAQALHTFGMLSSPLMNIATTILTNRDPFTDREIYDEFATGGEKLAAWGHYMWNLSLPPMVHGMSQLGEGKGFGALTRLIEHYNFTITKEGEEKHTKSQALWRMVGINITPIAPHEARAKNLKFEVAKINRLKGRIKKNAEDAFWNGMSVKDIEDMVRKDADKLKALYEGIKDKLDKPLPAKLKRTEKQRMKIMNEFLKKRKAG